VTAGHEIGAEPANVGFAATEDRVEGLGEEEDSDQGSDAEAALTLRRGRRSCTT